MHALPTSSRRANWICRYLTEETGAMHICAEQIAVTISDTSLLVTEGPLNFEHFAVLFSHRM